MAITTAQKAQIVQDFQRGASDTGSRKCRSPC
jgi:hypothetical protein